MPYERRQFVRVLFDAPARLVTAQGAVAVRVLDLSLRGALIRVPKAHPLQVGSSCRLQLQLGAARRQRITLQTRAMYLAGTCAGLLCQGMDIDSATHLRRLIELQLGDPALLERDLGELVGTDPRVAT